jgi:hypothetical protein
MNNISFIGIPLGSHAGSSSSRLMNQRFFLNNDCMFMIFINILNTSWNYSAYNGPDNSFCNGYNGSS